jgi:hypothetical protein
MLGDTLRWGFCSYFLHGFLVYFQQRPGLRSGKGPCTELMRLATIGCRFANSAWKTVTTLPRFLRTTIHGPNGRGQ